MVHQLPRGIRNNNPLNILLGSSTWLGRVRPNTDGRFEQFVHMKYGFRAAFLIIHRYIRVYHLHTIEAIVSRWCPDSTAVAYIQVVSQRTGIPANKQIFYGDKQTMVKLVAAMAFVETGFEATYGGRYLDLRDIESAYDTAN